MSRPLPPVTATDLHQRLAAADSLRIVDVREPAEFVSELGHVEPSELIPLGTLAQHLSRFSGETREIVVVCRSGMRAAQGAELLARAGHSVRVLTGGMIAWNDAKLPTSRKPG